MSDDVKIAVLMNKTMGQFQEHLRLNVVALTRYHEVQGVLANYRKHIILSSRISRGSRCNVSDKSPKERAIGQAKGKAKARIFFVSNVVVVKAT